MKSILKKNQLMITALAIMIAIAGYLQFAGNDLQNEYVTVDDETFNNTNTSMTGSGGIVSENYTTQDLLDLSEEELLQEGIVEIDSLDSDYEDEPVTDFLSTGLEVADSVSSSLTDVEIPEEGEIPGEAVFTAATGTSILADAKLLKEQTRAKNKATLMEIIESEGLSKEQKQEAVDSMVKMTEIAEREAAAEMLLEAKGYTDVVVSMHEGNVDVVVNEKSLDDVSRAQIEDIVKRKTGVSAENIVISTVVP